MLNVNQAHLVLASGTLALPNKELIVAMLPGSKAGLNIHGLGKKNSTN